MLTPDAVLSLLPEIALVAVAVWTYVGGAFLRSGRLWTAFALAGLAVAAMHLVRQGAGIAAGEQALATGPGPVALDGLAHLLRWLAWGAGVVFILTAAGDADSPQYTEVLGSILLIVAGMMLVAAADELVLLFVGLELVSIPTYVLLYLGRRTPRSDEAAIKYFFLSVLASAVLLYGLSFLYGAGGSTDLGEIRRALGALYAPTAAGPTSLVKLAVILIFAGLSFKLAAVPFHFYAPDVYQGTTSGNVGLLAVAPKVAGIAAAVRLADALPPAEHLPCQIALVLAMATMTLGNTLALWQKNLRRLLACSSIAHGGYLLFGLAVGLALRDPRVAREASGLSGLEGTLFYLAVYVPATAGALAALAHLGRRGGDVDTLDDLAGLAGARPGVATAVAVFMFSLAGIPPLAGFWGKLGIFLAALTVNPPGQQLDWMRPWFLALAIVGAVNAAIGAAYYLRVVAAMYFRQATQPLPRSGALGPLAATSLCALAVVWIGLFPGSLLARMRPLGAAATGAAHAKRATVLARAVTHAKRAGGCRPRVVEGSHQPAEIGRAG